MTKQVYRVLGGHTGRLSTSNYNIQSVPKVDRSKWKRDKKHVYVQVDNRDVLVRRKAQTPKAQAASRRNWELFQWEGFRALVKNTTRLSRVDKDAIHSMINYAECNIYANKTPCHQNRQS